MITIDSEGPIFVVDDSLPDRHIIKSVLRRSQLQNPVELFDSGRAVLERMDAVAEGLTPTPSLVLLDVNMPGIDGFDVLADIRGRPEFRHVPVVSMLSSSDAEEDRARAAELGATLYLAKQSGLARFVELVDATLANG